MGNTYQFTAGSRDAAHVPRTFTARLVSIPEYRAMNKAKAAVAEQFGVPEGHALTALLVSASVVDPSLSVGDALTLHREAPALYVEIAGPITEKFTAVVTAWERQVKSAVKKSKGDVRAAVKGGPDTPAIGATPPLPRMLPFRRKQ